MHDPQEIIDRADAVREDVLEHAESGLQFFLEGERGLYEYQDAVEGLRERWGFTEQHGMTAQQRVRRITNHLVEDEVDPVQRVPTPETDYVGVVNYQEHDWWYEFTEYNDVFGSLRRGVCAICIHDSDVDSQPFTRHTGKHGEPPLPGDDVELAEVLQEHREEEHADVDVDELEIGATLASGTTVGGNTAIHGGNQSDFNVEAFGTAGTASQVPKATAAGGLTMGTAGGGVQFSSVYNRTLWSPPWQTPGSGPAGVTTDTDNCVWHTDQNTNNIYKIDGDGSVITSFSAPGSNSRGVAYDQTRNGSIWNTDKGTGSTYRLDQTGSVITSFSAPQPGNENGITVDSTGSFWHSENRSAGTLDCIFKTDSTMSTIASFQSPSQNLTDLDVDSNDCIWLVESGNNHIYQVDDTGSQITSFSAPSANAWGVGLASGFDSVWISDRAGDNCMYQTTQTGSEITGNKIRVTE